MFKLILFLAAAAVAAWSGYWLYESRSYRGNLEAAFEAMRKAGWDAGHGRISISGFPVRFEATVVDPELRHRQTGIGWSGEFVRIISLSYDPYHAIVEFPEEHTVLLRDGRIGIAAEAMRASVKFAALDPPEASEAILESAAAKVELDGREFGLEQPLVALRRSERDGYGYDAAVRAISPGGGGGVLGGASSSIAAEASFMLERPPGPGACSRGPLRIISADIDSLVIGVRDALATAEGSFDFGQTGSPTGTAGFTLSNWPDFISALAASGYISAPHADRISKAIGLLALFSPESLTVTGSIAIQQGRIEFGGFLVGIVPGIPDICQFL